MVLTKVMKNQDQIFLNHKFAQANLGVGPQQNESTPASRIWDFISMNPCTFHGTKGDEDPQDFIEEVFKVVDVMGVTSRERAELVIYQLKDVSQE